jgi:hypothetical protein
MKIAILLTSIVLAAAPSPAAAAGFPGVNMRPYILFSSHLEVANIFEPSELTFEEQQQFITQGGAVFSSLSIQVEQQVPSSQVYRGIATPAQLLDLRNNLNAARIRGQRSCEIKAGGSQEGFIDFTWYSALGRRNSFRIVLTRTGGSGLPPCRASVVQILGHLRGFEAEILQNPNTEVLQTPP